MRRIIGYLRNAKNASKSRGETRKKQDPKPRRELFFSEAHPTAYNLLTSLPNIGLALGVTLIGALVMINMSRIMTVVMDPQIALEYLESNGTILAVLISMLAVLAYILYTVVWRYLFPDYFIRYGSADVYDGRLYWSDNRPIMQLWDRWYRSPPRTEIRYYIHQSILPLSLNVVTTTPDERMERKDMWSVVVHERSLRRVVDRRKKRTYYQTCDDSYHHLDLPTDYVGNSFDSRMKQMLDATTRASYGNPEVSVDIVRHGSTLIGDDFAAAVREVRHDAGKE